MKICIVCRAKSVPNATETFHRFPSNKIIALQWAKAIGREDSTFGKWTFVCSKHFEDKYFENRYSIKNPGKIIKVLFPKSIPSLFIKNEILPGVPSTSSDSLEPKKSQCDASTSNKENEVPCNIEESNLDTEHRFYENCLSPTSTRIAELSSPSMECRINARENDHNYASTPQSLKRKVRDLTEALAKSKKEVKLRRLQSTYLRRRVNSLKEVICELKDKFRICEDAVRGLNTLSGAPLHAFNRILKNSKRISTRKRRKTKRVH